MAFEKDSWQRTMMGEYYRLTEKYWTLKFDDRRSSAFWEALTDDLDKFIKTYDQKDDDFAGELAMLLLRHTEDQAKGKEVLCRLGDDPAVAAVFRHFAGARP